MLIIVILKYVVENTKYEENPFISKCVQFFFFTDRVIGFILNPIDSMDLMSCAVSGSEITQNHIESSKQD